MTNPVQYILCGIPFSGKTTLGQELKKRLAFEYINLDEIRAEKGYGDVKEDDIPDEAWKNIFAEADRRLLEYLKIGKNVANETAWVTRKWRDRTRNIARAAGFSTKVILLDIPVAVAKERWRKNRKEKQRYDTPDDEYESYIKDFEKPTPDEEVIIYHHEDDLEEWIKKNLA